MKEKITKEYILEICENVITNFDDFADEEKIKLHNKAYAKLEKVLDELEEDLQNAEEIFAELFKIKDPYLKHTFAVFALRLGILYDDALNILVDIKYNHFEVAPFIDLYLPIYQNPYYRYVARYVRKIDKVCSTAKVGTTKGMEETFEKIQSLANEFDIDGETLQMLISTELSNMLDIHKAAGYIIAMEKTDDHMFYLNTLEIAASESISPQKKFLQFVLDKYKK